MDRNADYSNGLNIRAAEHADATEIADVLCTSIRGLCQPDHGDDPALIAAWLANKTAENVAIWIAYEHLTTLVAERDGGIVGVGQINAKGHITLNYVLPTFRFMGVSKALVGALERQARTSGLSLLSLESTRTAHRFYLSMGYSKVEENEKGSHVMTKLLS